MTLWQKWLCLYPMPHYGRGCRISTLIMVPINFWRNSDLFKKKNIFLAQKLTILELFKENLWKFSKKISQTQNKNLWNLFGATLMILSIKLNNFGFNMLLNDLFLSKCHMPMFQSPVPPYPIFQNCMHGLTSPALSGISSIIQDKSTQHLKRIIVQKYWCNTWLF